MSSTVVPGCMATQAHTYTRSYPLCRHTSSVVDMAMTDTRLSPSRNASQCIRRDTCICSRRNLMRTILDSDETFVQVYLCVI